MNSRPQSWRANVEFIAQIEFVVGRHFLDIVITSFQLLISFSTFAIHRNATNGHDKQNKGQ